MSYGCVAERVQSVDQSRYRNKAVDTVTVEYAPATRLLTIMQRGRLRHDKSLATTIDSRRFDVTLEPSDGSVTRAINGG
eukprot:8922760-Pyramimonas_sp.AAC.1